MRAWAPAGWDRVGDNEDEEQEAGAGAGVETPLSALGANVPAVGLPVKEGRDSRDRRAGAAALALPAAAEDPGTGTTNLRNRGIRGAAESSEHSLKGDVVSTDDATLARRPSCTPP